MTKHNIPRPRLSKLVISNFRCIGPKPVVIDLDEIVVLVGPNNSGKSSILRAYEVVMCDGSKNGELNLDDFPNGKIESHALPKIELHTVVYDHSPGEKWIDETSGEKVVRELWTWANIGKAKRQGFNVTTGEWDDSVPWGAANVANSRRPQPHKVDAFSDPEVQSKEIIKLLTSIINDRVKSFINPKIDQEEQSEFVKLLEQVKTIQKSIISESQDEINKAQDGISELIKEVFPGYKVVFDSRPEDDIEKSISLFKAGSKLLMGPEEGFQSTIDRQGSGARRTLLWAALRYISESSSKNDRPHVLLLDEPELCLHPNAVREACRVLYDLPKTNKWQVMVTTHSPSFIDVSRDNTTIIRVERNAEGEIEGTTVYRPNKIMLNDDDKVRLKLLNICDPYVTEFFFGGHTIVVEGDTEYTAFKHVISQYPDQFKDVHIIRARGKATIISLIKILNHFGSRYSILHDSDYPTLSNGNKNGAWTTNENIRNAVYCHEDPTKVRLIASIRNFENAFLGEEVSKEKPYNALVNLMEKPNSLKQIRDLLEALVNHAARIPHGFIEWDVLEDLEKSLNNRTELNHFS
ncbi:ATP-dependent endonuclease [Fictibacillus arsenicus]|uniref:ATP-dependent endonuclease n=1 Tax=Fictibacillus arsenicus TaxID=255247 RepID=A0A1B1Z7D5_9BACL|nr:AAA family ATPase [Fictibacillus arsenicus]ANX13324.1 ATP-dependent endonuclease [Fictibacillus arsenicus]